MITIASSTVRSLLYVFALGFGFAIAGCSPTSGPTHVTEEQAADEAGLTENTEQLGAEQPEGAVVTSGDGGDSGDGGADRGSDDAPAAVTAGDGDVDADLVGDDGELNEADYEATAAALLTISVPPSDAQLLAIVIEGDAVMLAADIDWSMVAQAAERANAGAAYRSVTAAFAAIDGSTQEFANCIDCRDTIRQLIAGEMVDKTALQSVLAYFSQ